MIIYLIGFFIVAIAAYEIAKKFQKIKFPLITGLIITGIIGGSSVLNFVTQEAVEKLNFLNQIALAIIAFSAGSELYLDDLRSRITSIKWMTIGQLVITFIMSSVVIYFSSRYVPFMVGIPHKHKIAISILFATIFVARSPSSAIAVINEMRANGPFTKTVMGVTVVKDVLVIIIFAISFSIAKAFIKDEQTGALFFFLLIFELIMSFVLGYLTGKLLQVPFNINLNHKVKIFMVILLGYLVYIFADVLKQQTAIYFNHEIVIEPLLISIIASFVLTNYSKHRIEFAELLEEISPTIYIIFFTLVGASLSIQTLMSVFGIAVTFFFLRLLTMYFGGLFGVLVAKDDKRYLHIAWMPYLTQAGVALGLATIIAHEFPSWGHQFETIVIAIIVINQLVGPPLFKYTLSKVGETHLKANMNLQQSTRDAVIFGIESQSIALANQLEKHKWTTRMVCMDDYDINDTANLNISSIGTTQPSIKDLEYLELENVEAVVLMLSDSKNFHLAELLYENYGTKELIVRLNNRENFEKFHKLGALIIEPTTAMVSLLDHFVRSPNAASLLLGMDDGQDTMDVEITNDDVRGLRIRELRLPTDVIILSIKRKGQLLMTHGYTRLRLGDVLTLVGSEESLEKIKLKYGVN